MKTILALFLFAGLTVSAADVTRVQVRTTDGFGGDAGSVLTRCQTKAGAPYDANTVARDVSSLRDSGAFEDIRVEANEVAQGVEVTFIVRRKVRFVAPLVVKGCDFFSESRIAKEAELKDGFLYGEADLAAAAAKVRLAYQKKWYLDAQVSYETTILAGNDVTIAFTIEEGARSKVNEYVYEGRSVVDAAALDGALQAKRWWNPATWFSGAEKDPTLVQEDELNTAVDQRAGWDIFSWFTDDPVTGDQQAQACTRLEKVYRNKGYLDVKVTGPERVAVGDEKADFVFTISEGRRYTIGSVKLAGVTKYPVDVVCEKAMVPTVGEIAGEAMLEEAAHRIKIVVGSGDTGLADSRVDFKCIPSLTDESVVDVLFEVKEGVPVVIDDIVIRGNDYTKDKVIRREIALGPGDRMLEDRAERSQKKLENLDYFSRVRYYLEPSGKGKDANGAEYRNLVYEVEEKNTGSFMVGLGASSEDSVYVSAELSQNNFDLFAPSKLFRGAGQKGRVYVAWGPRYQSAEVGFVEPYFLNRTLELSVDIYRRMRWYDEYDLYRTGARVDLAYPVKFWPTGPIFGRLGFGISGEYIQFDDVEKGYYEFENRLVSFEEEERRYGDALEPVLHLFWARSTTDRARLPTTGGRSRVFFDLAPAGDNEYWRAGVSHRQYFNVWKRYGHVLMVAARAETIDAISDDVPIYNRMFLGGARSIRGIEYRNVAPMARRLDTGSYVPWGGQTLFCMNFEYTLPIVSMLRVAAFSDVGSIGVDCFDLDFSDTLAWTVGVGLRLDIPSFPIRLDFGTPIKKPDHADEEVFSFTVGYDF